MMRELTEQQKDVIARLVKANCPFLAHCTEEHWKRGESYYIDSRVRVSSRLRADFNKAQKSLEGQCKSAKQS